MDRQVHGKQAFPVAESRLISQRKHDGFLQHSIIQFLDCIA